MPVLLGHFSDTNNLNWNVYLYSFYIIAIGAIGCILAGYISRKIGSSKVAFGALSLSGISCLLAPLFFLSGNPFLFFSFMLIWGLAVVADSPMFSTMVAQSAIPTLKGTALTIVNCIGFAITIISIQLLTHLKNEISLAYLFMLLAAGPLFALLYKVKSSARI
jgi:MFS family permease